MSDKPPLRMKCPFCEKLLRVQPELIGKKFKCSNCGSILSHGGESDEPEFEPQMSARPRVPETTRTETSDPAFVIGIKRRTVLIIAVTCFGGMFAVCAICGGFLYYSSGEYERQIEEAIERNAVVQRYIGSDVAIIYDETQSLMLSGLTEYCYEVRGPLGSGTLYADFVTVDADTEKIGYGMLELSSGATYDLMSGERISGENKGSTMSALRNKALSARRDEFNQHLRELLRESPDAFDQEEYIDSDSRRNPFSNLQASLTRLGDLSMRRGETDEAIKHYQKALEVGADYAPAHRGLGDAKIRERKVSEALAEFRTAVKLDPNLAGAHNSLAWALVTHPAEDGEYQDLDEAIASAKKACELNVDDLASLNTLGVALYRNGDWDEAIKALKESVDLGADIPHNWLFIAMAHWQQGNKEVARSLLAKSTAWREQNKPDDELIRFFAEAEKLIGSMSMTGTEK